MSSVQSSRQRLHRWLDHQRELLDQLLQSPPLLRGSFRQVFTRCGKPNCWCAQATQGHPHARLTWSEQGQLTTRKVPPEAVDRVRELTHNYRQFRSRRGQLLALELRLYQLLDGLEQALLTQAQKPVRSVGLTCKISPRQPRGRQKRSASDQAHT